MSQTFKKENILLIFLSILLSLLYIMATQMSIFLTLFIAILLSIALIKKANIYNYSKSFILISLSKISGLIIAITFATIQGQYEIACIIYIITNVVVPIIFEVPKPIPIYYISNVLLYIFLLSVTLFCIGIIFDGNTEYMMPILCFSLLLNSLLDVKTFF